MRCPYCDHEDTRVANSRPSPERNSIRRRRVCDACGGRFTTHEVIEKVEKQVLKTDGRQVEFDAEKLLKGIRLACEKRPVSEERVLTIAREVEREAYQNGHKPVPTKLLGELVLEKLRSIDRVAYLRFASVYKEFKNLDDFQGEIKSLRGEAE